MTDCLADLGAGAEKQIFELARRLDKERYSVTVVSQDTISPITRQQLDQANCSVLVLRVKRIYGLSGLIQGRKFYRFLRQRRVKIVQTYHFGSDIWGAFWARRAGVPLIISNRRDMGFWRRPWHGVCYWLIRGWVKKIVAVSHSVKARVMQTENVSANRIEVIYNGVEIPRGLPASKKKDLRRSLGISDEDVVLIQVANLRPVKGHGFLIEALGRLVTQFPQVKLALVGEDTMRGDLQRRVEKSGLKKQVLFLGKRDDVQELLTIADIGVMPSLSEGMSNAILEYMAAGIPVVATSVGGNPELVKDGFNGLLVLPQDVDQLELALAALIRDSSKRDLMGAIGRRMAEEDFSFAKMVKDYAALYETVFPPPVRILHFVSSQGVFGAEQVILSLAKFFNNGNYQAVIGAVHDRRFPQSDAVIQAAQELKLPTIRVSCSYRFDWAAIFELKKLLQEMRIDVLHTHNYKSDLIGLLAARLAGVPVVATAHGFTGMTKAVSSYEKWDRFILERFFDRVIVVTEELLTKCSPEKRRVIRNGLDISRFHVEAAKGLEFRKKFGLSRHHVVVGTVGRLSPEKNQKLLLEGMRPSLKKNPELRVMIVGEGPEKGNLVSFCWQEEITSNVIFCGHIKDMPSAYQAMDLFVLPSLREAMPLTIFEAMASSVAVIATRVGGVPSVIEDGRTGLLVEAGDSPALAAKIEFLLNRPSHRSALAKAGLQAVQKHFSNLEMCEQYKKVYEELIRLKSNPTNQAKREQYATA